MTSIERTAYPQFRRLTSARVLHVFFTPAEDEVAWARERTETPGALLALLVDLKCFQKMARFCSREEIPQAVTDHVRHCLGQAPEVEPDHGAARTASFVARLPRRDDLDGEVPVPQADNMAVTIDREFARGRHLSRGAAYPSVGILAQRRHGGRGRQPPPLAGPAGSPPRTLGRSGPPRAPGGSGRPSGPRL